MVGGWLLILWLSCDSRAMAIIEVESYKACTSTGQEWIDGRKDGVLSCKHYECLQVKDRKKGRNDKKQVVQADRKESRKD